MSLVGAISKTMLFNHLRKAQLARIAKIARWVNYDGEATIFGEGEYVSTLYLVDEGSVKLTMAIRLWNTDTTLRSIVTVVEEGGTLGWSALVEPNLATMSAEAVGLCRLVAIDSHKLRALLDKDPQMGYEVMTALAALVALRLQATRNALMSERAQDLLNRPIPL